MPQRDYIVSINDYEAAYGSPWGKLAFMNSGLTTYGGRLKKLNDPLLTGTSGSFQRIIGPQLWANLNTDRQLFAALRKKEWTESGIRVITSYAATKVRGVAEGDTALGDTVKPGFAQYFPTIKLMETLFDQALVSKFHGQIAEGVTWEQFRDFMGLTHGKGINETLNTTNGTLAGTSFESIDRVVAANSEFTGPQTGVAANDLDIFGLDRDAGASFADAQVLHNSNTDRDLSLRLINSLQRVTQVGSGDYNPANYFFYTGPDTLQTWTELLQPQQRFDEKEGSFSPLNGVKLGMGGSKETTFLLAVYNQQPIIVSENAVKDTISRIYNIHRDHLWFQVVQPTVYREVGISTGQELLLNRYADRGLFYTAGELVSNFFGANGKLIDLK